MSDLGRVSPFFLYTTHSSGISSTKARFNIYSVIGSKHLFRQCNGFGGHLWANFDIVLHASSKQPEPILVQFQICLGVQLVTWSLQNVYKKKILQNWSLNNTHHNLRSSKKNILNG